MLFCNSSLLSSFGWVRSSFVLARMTSFVRMSSFVVRSCEDDIGRSDESVRRSFLQGWHRSFGWVRSSFVLARVTSFVPMGSFVVRSCVRCCCCCCCCCFYCCCCCCYWALLPRLNLFCVDAVAQWYSFRVGVKRNIQETCSNWNNVGNANQGIYIFFLIYRLKKEIKINTCKWKRLP